MYRKSAFTLLEVLVVIIIIGLLAVFGHAAYLGYVQRAKVTEALNLLEEYQSIALQLRARTGAMAPYYVLFTDENQTGLLTGIPSSSSASKTINSKYVDSIAAFSGTDGGGNSYLLLGAKLQHDGIFVDDADYVYVAAIQTPAGLLRWECGISVSQDNTIGAEYLPPTCQSSLP